MWRPYRKRALISRANTRAAKEVERRLEKKVVITFFWKKEPRRVNTWCALHLFLLAVMPVVQVMREKVMRQPSQKEAAARYLNSATRCEITCLPHMEKRNNANVQAAMRIGTSRSGAASSEKYKLWNLPRQNRPLTNEKHCKNVIRHNHPFKMLLFSFKFSFKQCWLLRFS